MIRNLLYRLTPFTGSNYIWNLQELFKRIDIFNGRRIIAIATGEGCDPLRKVDAILSCLFGHAPSYRHEHEQIITKVEDTLWENTTFIPLLTKLKGDFDPDSITFYGHSKGVTRSKPGHVWAGWEHDLCAHVWAEAMYHYNLDMIENVESKFNKGYQTVGCFRRIGKWAQFHPDNTWHYSGNFFWVNQTSLFKRDWTKIEPTKFGPEGYVGSLFHLEESACLRFDNVRCEPYQPACLKSLRLLP